jgi:hypothetical protein
MADSRRILMVALHNKAEALRMAGGLTLLDDRIEVVVWDGMPAGPATAEQLAALEFAEVPVAELAPARDLAALARQIMASDVVYCV